MENFSGRKINAQNILSPPFRQCLHSFTVTVIKGQLYQPIITTNKPINIIRKAQKKQTENDKRLNNNSCITLVLAHTFTSAIIQPLWLTIKQHKAQSHVSIRFCHLLLMAPNSTQKRSE